MSPPTYHVGNSPSTVFLAPASDNRGIPERKAQHHSQPAARVNGNRYANITSPVQIRPLTVNEALQYSPLSSIVPFGPDVIPLPTVGLPGTQPIFSTTSERELARQPIELLNREMGQSSGTSRLLQRTSQDLQPYLDPDQLTEFKFKVPVGLNGDEQARRRPNSTNNHHTTSYQLTPFANMMLNSTDIAYRYPTPSSPGSTFSQGASATESLQQKLSGTPATPQRFTNNEIAYANNARLNAATPSLLTPERTKSYPVVIIPPLPPSSQHSEYITFPDEGPERGSKDGESRKRKRDDDNGIIRETTKVKDQRGVSDEASRSLQELIRDIFEAEDQLQPDISGAPSEEARSFFVSVGTEDKTFATLAPAVHVKLEVALQRVISCGRFPDVPLDQLCRLQKLCEGALIAAEAEEPNFETEWTEDNATQWFQRIDVMDSGLRAARTIARIMAGGRDEKQIYSEELLQSVVSVVRKATDSYVIPVVESRSTGSGSETFRTASAHRKNVSSLMHGAGKVLRLLADLLVKVDVAETTITAIEFFLTRLLFVENAHSEKESVLGIHKFEALRRIAMDIIAEIFSRYPEQRTFLFDEILTSLQKLPVTRQNARQFKLKDGKTIQLVSALIMRLVQTS
ncbi:Sister chromatid cohesion protein 2, partial [Hypocenomyce scalaris]|nr:Sister chromatid cohesion protein 2 [Hypocenomyce scalaris]